MDTGSLFQQPSHFPATFGKVKGYSHSVISLGLVCGVTGCDLGTVLVEVVKKNQKKTKQSFTFSFLTTVECLGRSDVIFIAVDNFSFY